MSRFVNSLRLEKTPYIITILFASIGWAAKHSVDRLLASPIIECTSEVRHTTANKTIVITLHNISHDKTFKNLSFALLLPTKASGKFLLANKAAAPPAWEGDIAATWADHSAQFHFPALHPEWEVKLIADFSGNTIPVLRVRDSDTPVRLVPASLPTFLVRHELKFILGMVVVWALVILALLSYGRRTSEGLEPNPDPSP